MADLAPIGKKRVVSLISSATEIIFDLGCGSWLVGRSHECDYPEVVKNLPICSTPLFETEGSSLEIDERVRNLAQQALSIYKVDSEKLNQLKPDVILTQTQCEVCAVSLKEVQKAMAQWVGHASAEIVPLHPNVLADLWQDMLRVGKALGVQPTAETRIKALQRNLQKIEAAVDTKVIPAWQGKRPVVACIEWMEPAMLSGNWIPELVWKAGGLPLLPDGSLYDPAKKAVSELIERSQTLSLEKLDQANADIICIFPCGFDLKRTLKEFQELAKKPEWKTLKAAKNSRIFLADGNAYFNRPGPRLIESTQLLQDMFLEAAQPFSGSQVSNNFFRFSGNLPF